MAEMEMGRRLRLSQAIHKAVSDQLQIEGAREVGGPGWEARHYLRNVEGGIEMDFELPVGSEGRLECVRVTVMGIPFI